MGAGRATFVLLAALAAVAGGCRSEPITLLRAPVEAPPLPEGAVVRLFLPGQEPPPYTVLATMVVDVDGTALWTWVWDPLSEAARLAEAKAREIGGDCLVLVGVRVEDYVREMHEEAHFHETCWHFRWIVGKIVLPPRKEAAS
jgi:hypothetical protein